MKNVYNPHNLIESDRVLGTIVETISDKLRQDFDLSGKQELINFLGQNGWTLYVSKPGVWLHWIVSIYLVKNEITIYSDFSGDFFSIALSDPDSIDKAIAFCRESCSEKIREVI